MNSITYFLAGLILSWCVAWLLLERQAQQFQRTHAGDQTAIDVYRRTIAKLGSQIRVLQHEATMDAPLAVGTVIPRRYAVPERIYVPRRPATDPFVAVARAAAQECARVREHFDRGACFDPGCPRCNPAPQDTPTGSLTLPEAVS